MKQSLPTITLAPTDVTLSFPILDMSCFIIFKDFLDGGSQDSGILKDERQNSYSLKERRLPRRGAPGVGY